MPTGREFVDYAMELLGPFGTVSARRMFGGMGIFLDGLMFAIVFDDALWFKTDEISRGEFEALGSEPLTFLRSGKTATLGFHRAPDAALDSPAAALPWARSAYAAALRARGRRQDHPIELSLAPFAPTASRRPKIAASPDKKRAAKVKRPTTRRITGTRTRAR